MKKRTVNIVSEYGKGNVIQTLWSKTRDMIYLGSIEFCNPGYIIRVWTDGKKLYTCDEAPCLW